MDTITRADSKIVPGNKGFCYGVLSKGASTKIGCKFGDMIIFVLSGRIRIMAEIYKEYYYSENTFFILKQDDYKLEAISDAKIIRVCLNDEWLKFYNRLKNTKGLKRSKFLYQMPWLPTHPHVDSYLFDIKQKLSHNKEISQHLQDKLQTDLIALLEKCFSTKELYQFFVAMDREVLDFYKFIMNSYRNRGLEEIIIASKLSPSTFNRRFQELFGVSPCQWIIAKRADEINRKLVDTNKSIAEIMKRYNFTDYSHFNRFCKMHLGATPTEIRKGTAKAWG